MRRAALRQPDCRSSAAMKRLWTLSSQAAMRGHRVCHRPGQLSNSFRRARHCPPPRMPPLRPERVPDEMRAGGVGDGPAPRGQRRRDMMARLGDSRPNDRGRTRSRPCRGAARQVKPSTVPAPAWMRSFDASYDDARSCRAVKIPSSVARMCRSARSSMRSPPSRRRPPRCCCRSSAGPETSTS